MPENTMKTAMKEPMAMESWWGFKRRGPEGVAVVSSCVLMQVERYCAMTNEENLSAEILAV
jgi:hypothetical protein